MLGDLSRNCMYVCYQTPKTIGKSTVTASSVPPQTERPIPNPNPNPSVTVGSASLRSSLNVMHAQIIYTHLFVSPKL